MGIFLQGIIASYSHMSIVEIGHTHATNKPQHVQSLSMLNAMHYIVQSSAKYVHYGYFLSCVCLGIASLPKLPLNALLV